jgi:glycosyltransferase involved in cell wall biosynthesis
VKKIMTYGREISRRNIRYINKLPNQQLVFTGCSADLISRGGIAGKWAPVYNAIEFSKYNLAEQVAKDAPLMFLGRVERVKGCHTAIRVAKATNNRLIIAGNISPLGDEQEYFKKEIEPFIDGQQIVHVGAVNDEQKNYYLGQARALLFPIDWNEPFGMVMVEAMACGTPVIGFNKGSVPEVIDQNITGIRVDTMEEMKNAIPAISSIDRRKCREQAFMKFDVSNIIQHYISLIK